MHPHFRNSKKRTVSGTNPLLNTVGLNKSGVRYSFVFHTISDLRRAKQKLVKAEPNFHSLFKFHVGDIWQESFYFRSGTVLRAD